MATTGGSEDVRDQEERLISLAYVVDGDSVDIVSLSLGGVFDCQLGPRAFGAALHLDMLECNTEGIIYGRKS